LVAFRGYYIPAEQQTDVVQQTMLDLWQRVRSPGFACRSFDGLVRTITFRRCVDWMRQARPAVELAATMAVEASRPDWDYVDQERRSLARRVLGELCEPCRELMRQLAEGRTYREIAEQQQRSEGALRVQLCECLKEARRILSRLAAGSSTRAREGTSE
jgi:RNA polymerase sigma factor (sigma-70 family)